jgi:hypothetical protein
MLKSKNTVYQFTESEKTTPSDGYSFLIKTLIN